MTLVSRQVDLEYLGVALVLLGGSFGLIKWVGHTIRSQLGPGVSRRNEPIAPGHADAVPPALVKQAIERGLLTSAQLAGMSPMERQFVLASLKGKLDASAPPATPAASTATPATAPSGRQRLHCPLCGGALVFPALAPLVSNCGHCGARIALREDEGGRYVLNVAPRT